MAFRGCSAVRRFRWILAFAVVLLAATAVPVLAAPTQPEASAQAGDPGQPPAPSPAEVAALERKEKEQREWLASPRAARERAASQQEFSGVSASEARSILLEAFPEALASLNWDPGRVLTGLQIEKQLGTYTALVGNGNGGERRLLESSVPVQSELGGEGKKPVDLTLQRSGGGFAPANPIAELELPASAEGAIKLHEGLSVRLPTSNNHEAMRLGKEGLFFPETERSTDTLLSPVAGGVEISEQLRSRESPDRFSFGLELPKGASLRTGQEGGAEVLSEEGAVIEKVPPPSAVDAQGASVPVEMKVAGESLVVEVADQAESSFAYPILLDPEFIEETTNFGAWALPSIYFGFELRNLGSSLNPRSIANTNYWANTYAQWTYTAPGETAFVAAAYFNPVDFLVGGCPTAQPHGYLGLYNIYKGVYDALGVYSGGNSEGSFWGEGEFGDHLATIGIGTGAEAVKISCYHELYVGGYSFLLGDEDRPSWNSVEWPSSWMNETPVPIHVSATDSGLGMKSFLLETPNAAGTEFEFASSERSCSGSRQSSCSSTWAAELTNYRPQYLPTGVSELQVIAEDPVENHSEARTVRVKVDHTAPALGLSGTLTTQGRLGMGKPEYGLKWKAEDGGAAASQSGVASVVIKVDGTVVHSETPGCSGTTNCAAEGEWQFVASEYSEGKHEVTVTATDAVGNQATRTLTVSDSPEVTSPRSGEKTARQFKLTAAWRQSGYSQITWRYRLKSSEGWSNLPAGSVKSASGEEVSWPAAVEGQESAPLYWDVASSGLPSEDLVNLEVQAKLQGESVAEAESQGVAVQLNRSVGGPKDALAPVGPGSVDLLTGNLSAPRTDVSIPALGTSLEFSRTYNSREANSDPSGILGPGWIAGTPVEEAGGAAWKSVRDANAAGEGPYAVLTDLEGYEYSFELLAGGEYRSPPEASELELSHESGTFVLADPEGNRTEFGKEEEAGDHIFLPTAVIQLGGSHNKTQVVYETKESKRRLKLLIGPSAEGVECTAANATAKLGCRSLSFNYQSPGEWGGLAGMGDRLTSITYYGPKESESEAGKWEEGSSGVAKYAYDKEGRLTEEWDPRVSPPLKETYGYAADGELHEVTPAGQEPWILGYEEEPRPTGSSGGAAREGLVASYSFDEGEGTVAKDSSGNGHNATIEGAKWTSEGKYGDALEFNAEKGDVLTVPDSEDLRLEAFTLEAWVDPFESREEAPIIAKTDPEAYGYALYAGVEGAAGHPQGSTTYKEWVGGYAYSPEALQTNHWSHVAVTSDGKEIRLYINGELVDERKAEEVGVGKGPLQIGGDEPFAHGGFFDGKIDEVRVYNRALSDEEIKEDKKAAVEETTQWSPVASYSFDEGEGTVAKDSSGNGHNATIEGAKWTSEGKYGDALEFNAEKGDVLTVPDSEDLRLEAFTLEAWVDPFESREEAPIIAKTDPEAYGYALYAGVEGAAGHPQGSTTYKEWVGGYAYSPEALQTNHWSHVAVTSDGKEIRLYINGELVDERKAEEVGVGKGPLQIGGDEPFAHGGFFDGKIDEVRVYNRALSAGEIGEDEITEVKEELHPRLKTVRRASLLGGSEPAKAQTTIVYGVPLEGGAAPYGMGRSEVAAWGQTDVPTTATAVFPPDEVPASHPGAYTRANVYYMDREGQLVNTAAPSGAGALEPAIATAEPDEHGNVVRELSADNRLRALAAEGESVARSEQLETKRVYNSEGSEMLEEWGPLHEVKLQTGANVEARLHKVLTYDDSEAPKEAGVPEPHLPTKEATGAEIPGEEEAEQHVTEYRYDWNLREPTETIVDPSGLDIVTTTAYNDTTGLPIKQSQPSDPEGKGAGTTETVYYSATGSGECNGAPQYAGLVCEVMPAAQASGEGRPELLVTKYPAYNSLGEPTEVIESPGGGSEHARKTLTTYDSAGRRLTGEIEGGGEWVPKTETVYSSTNGQPVTQRFVCESECGSPRFASAFGSSGSEPGQLNGPRGIASDQSGHVWVVDRANDRVEEFSESGEYLSQFGSAGSGTGQFDEPWGIAVTSSGNIWVTDTGNHRVEEFSKKGEFIQEFGTKAGSEGSRGTEFVEPEGIAVAPDGKLWVADGSGGRVAEFRESAASESERFVRNASGGGLEDPLGLAVDSSANVWVADEEGNDLLEYDSEGNFIRSVGSYGTGDGQFHGPTGVAIGPSGDIFVADRGNGRIEEFASNGTFVAKFGSAGSGNEDFSEPRGIAFGSRNSVFVADKGNNRVKKWQVPGEGPRVFASAFGSSGSEPGQLNGPRGIASDQSGHVWVVDRANDRVEEFSESGEYLSQFGSAGSGTGQFDEPWGIAVTSSGNIWVTDTGNHRVEEFSKKGEFIQEFGTKAGSEGSRGTEFVEPEGIAVAPDGKLWVADGSGGRVAEFRESVASESERFVRNASGGGLEDPLGLAVDSSANVWVADEEGNDLLEYDSEGNFIRSVGSYGTGDGQFHGPTGVAIGPSGDIFVADRGNGRIEEFASNGTFVAKFGSAGSGNEDFSEPRGIAFGSRNSVFVADKGNNRVKKWTAKPAFDSQAIHTTYDALGRLTAYKDANGNVATTSYDIDGRPVTSADNKGSQTITYSSTSGLPTKLEDSGAGTFTASYDAEGNLVDRTLPDGLTAETTYSPASEPVHLTYTKEGNCGESCTWLDEGVERSVFGQILTDKNTLAEDKYTYDNAGRLIEAQETPSGGSCTTRSYVYDADSNRTSMTTREPEGGGCSSEGGTIQKYSYDAADRLEGEGLTYDSFGRITNLPGEFAGGEGLETGYFATNMVASQSQGAVTNTYELDATLRQDARTQTGGSLEGREVLHFDGGGDSPAWTARGETWTRNIAGMGGELVGVEEKGSQATLQLTNLHGDVVATAESSPTATKLKATSRFDEFGNPMPGTVGRFGWLGGKARRTELASGVIQLGARSYVPEIGRFLTPDPIPGGSANPYDYALQDPINNFDLNGTRCTDVHGNKLCPGKRERRELHRATVRAEEFTVREERRRGMHIGCQNYACTVRGVAKYSDQQHRDLIFEIGESAIHYISHHMTQINEDALGGFSEYLARKFGHGDYIQGCVKDSSDAAQEDSELFSSGEGIPAAVADVVAACISGGLG